MEDPNDLYDGFEERAVEIYNKVKQLQIYLRRHESTLGKLQLAEANRILKRFIEDLE